LLQGCDNLSLLACVAFGSPAHLLHPLPLNDGGSAEIQVESIAIRHLRLYPWPFAERSLSFKFPGRHVKGLTFNSSADLERAFSSAPIELLEVKLSK
jgi:hypothetical protein